MYVYVAIIRETEEVIPFTSFVKRKGGRMKQFMANQTGWPEKSLSIRGPWGLTEVISRHYESREQERFHSNKSS